MPQTIHVLLVVIDEMPESERLQRLAALSQHVADAQLSVIKASREALALSQDNADYSIVHRMLQLVLQLLVSYIYRLTTKAPQWMLGSALLDARVEGQVGANEKN